LLFVVEFRFILNHLHLICPDTPSLSFTPFALFVGQSMAERPTPHPPLSSPAGEVLRETERATEASVEAAQPSVVCVGGVASRVRRGGGSMAEKDVASPHPPRSSSAGAVLRESGRATERGEAAQPSLAAVGEVAARSLLRAADKRSGFRERGRQVRRRREG
jgi:hypothetical protein